MEEEKRLNIEEIEKVVKTVEKVTGTSINWKFDNPKYGRRIKCFVYKGDKKITSFRVADTGYYHSLRNNILTKYVKYIEDNEMAEE